MYSWEEYGLKLHVSRKSTASFKVRVVNPITFELPEGTELLSPFYWVTSDGDTAGPVGVEIQHNCARITNRGLSGLGVAIHKVHDKPEPPYLFKEVKGHLSSSSGYAKMKVEFSDRILALFRRLRRALNLEMRFQARLYYEPLLTTTCKAHLVIVPDTNPCQVGDTIYLYNKLLIMQQFYRDLLKRNMLATWLEDMFQELRICFFSAKKR